MAGPSEFTDSTPPSDNLRIALKPSCWTGASSESVYGTAFDSESLSAIPSASATLCSACSESVSYEKKRKAESGDDASVEDAIERSKVHWSELSEASECDEEEAEVSNVKAFQCLQKHSTWGHFFRTFGDGGIYDFGELEVDDKPFAAGAQAELYRALVTWRSAKDNAYDQERGIMYVLKVFRKGTFLRDLQMQWPNGLFREYEVTMSRGRFGESQPIRYTSGIQCGTLLPDGRFAFLLVREVEDLRVVIDHCMKARASIDCGPFSRKIEYRIMSMVARAMVELHDLNIVHRDLKASNVLFSHFYKKMDKWVYDYDFNVANVEVGSALNNAFFVADFECSIGVVGTGFFRAPELLQALKDKVLNKKPHLFSKEADVYSYGMLCYEILTGKLPFEGHHANDYDLVLGGTRPDVPDYVEDWACDLLCRCWQSNPTLRPTFVEILNIVLEVDWRHENS